MKSAFYILALAIGPLATTALAAPKSPLPQGAMVATARSSGNVNEKLKLTVIHNGDPGGSLAAGSFTTIDTVVLTCPASGCTIVNQVLGEVGGNSTAGAQWAICTVIDGTYANPGCPYQGEVPADSTYESGNASQSISALAKGKHTVETQLYAGAAMTSGEYQAVYSLYTP